MPRARSTTNHSQRMASLRETLQDLRQTIDQHECGGGRDSSFQRAAVASIDHIDSILADFAGDSLFPSQWGAQALETTSAHPSSSGFIIHEFSILPQSAVSEDTLQQDQQGKKRDNLSTFCKNLPQNLPAWQEKRDALGLSTTDRIRAAFGSLILLDDPAPISEPPTWPDALTAFVTNKRKHANGGGHQSTYLSRLGDLVFLGVCGIASEFDTDAESIDDAMKQYLNNTISKPVLCHYRSVPQKISNWMNQLYETCGCAAFELFLLANKTISSYDSLARSAGIDAAFSNRVRPLIPTELHNRDLPTNLTFYLPFLVWASIIVNVKLDCFDQIKNSLPLSPKFGHSDFKECFSFLVEGHAEMPRALAQSEHNPRVLENDAAGANTTRTKRSAPREPRGNSSRPRTRPPNDPVASHHTATQDFTEGNLSQGSDAEDVDRPHPGVMDTSHRGTRHLRSSSVVGISAQATAFQSAKHYDFGLLAADDGPPAPALVHAEIHPQYYAHAVGDVHGAVASCGVDQTNSGPLRDMDDVLPEGVALAWSPEVYLHPWAPYGSTLGSAAGRDSVWTGRDTRSEQIGGVERYFSL